MRVKTKTRVNFKLPPCVPETVQADGVHWEPTWQERALEYSKQQIALALAEVKRIELIEQRGWLTAATQRAVAAALEIDEGLRKAALAEEIEKTEKWWADTVAREQKQNEAIMAEFQKQMDRGVYKQMKARADKAKRDMDRDNARLERLALLKRGVLRGTRKQFAAQRLAY